MSLLQEQAVQLIRDLSDDNVKFLIEFIQKFMQPQSAQPLKANALEALGRLNAARDEVWQYLPADFDPERELMEARAEKYENVN